MATKDIIQKLETLYQNLMTKDLTPDEEAQAKVQLLELLSSIKAYTVIQGGEQGKNILEQTNSLKDLLLEWDPYGSAWFKEEKTLINNVYNLLAALKTLTIQKGATSESMNINALKQKVEDVSVSLKSEITDLKNEIATIKKSVIAIATAVKEQLSNKKRSKHKTKQNSSSTKQKSNPIDASSIKTESSPIPKPIPLPSNKTLKVAPKPISLPKPVPIPSEDDRSELSPQPFRRSRAKPISIPKPEQIQESSLEPEPIPLDDGPAQSPVPLFEHDYKEPISPTELKGESKSETHLLGALSSAKKEPIKKPDKEHLFNLFSGGSSESSGVTELEIIEESSIPGSDSIQILHQRTQTGTGSGSDPETLYQELISLEGRRYSIERSIRDLKNDRENEVITDQEYKEKLSQLLNKLQTISKRIGSIRGKLD